MAPEPFQIAVPQTKVDTLKAKLSLAEFPDELEAANWDLGVPLGEIQRLTEAWKTWDWRQAEERLNKTPQYHTGIKVDGFDELDVHFIWQKSEVETAIPLLFVHGCELNSPNAQRSPEINTSQGPAPSSKPSPSSPLSPNPAAQHSTSSPPPSLTSVSAPASRPVASPSPNTPRPATS